MAKKKLTLGMAAAAAAGTAVYMAKKSQDKKVQNGTQNKVNSGWSFNKKNEDSASAKAFIIPMVIMKLLPDRKSRKV